MRIEIKFDRGGIGMKYLIWLVGGIAALDQGMKSEIEQETDVNHSKASLWQPYYKTYLLPIHQSD